MPVHIFRDEHESFQFFLSFLFFFGMKKQKSLRLRALFITHPPHLSLGHISIEPWLLGVTLLLGQSQARFG